MIGRCVGNECYCTVVYQLAQSCAIDHAGAGTRTHAQELRCDGSNFQFAYC